MSPLKISFRPQFQNLISASLGPKTNVSGLNFNPGSPSGSDVSDSGPGSGHHHVFKPLPLSVAFPGPIPEPEIDLSLSLPRSESSEVSQGQMPSLPPPVLVATEEKVFGPFSRELLAVTQDMIRQEVRSYMDEKGKKNEGGMYYDQTEAIANAMMSRMGMYRVE